MMRFIACGILAVLALFFGGCCKKKTYCDHGEMKVAFVGFDRAISRSIILKRYALGDWEKKKALDSANMTHNVNKADTVWLNDYTVTSGLQNGIVTLGNEWVIEMRLAARKYRFINGIEGDGHRAELVRCGDDKTRCTENVARYTFDGNKYEGSTLYIIP